MEALRKAGPAIAVINKVDLLNDFAALEARKKQMEEFGIFDAIVTVSAKDGTGCEELFPLLKQYANPGPHYFDDDAFTDMPEKELVAELVREKALLFMREEIPRHCRYGGKLQRTPGQRFDRHQRGHLLRAQEP